MTRFEHQQQPVSWQACIDNMNKNEGNCISNVICMLHYAKLVYNIP
jgi:hypothetical protein